MQWEYESQKKGVEKNKRFALGYRLYTYGYRFYLGRIVFFDSRIRSVLMEERLVLKNRLKEVRTQQGMSQNQLAQLVGVSRNTISSIETEQFNPTAKLALILCIALDTKFEDLFYF